MAEAHSGAERDQAGVDCGVRCCPIDPQIARGLPHQQRFSQRLGGGQQQQAAGIGGERANAPLEGLLDPVRQRESARKAEPTC
jgi:hypothetical protein